MKLVLQGAMIRKIELIKCWEFDEGYESHPIYEYKTKIVTEEGCEIICSNSIFKSNLDTFESFMSMLQKNIDSIVAITIDVSGYRLDVGLNSVHSYTVRDENGETNEALFP